MEHHTLKMYVNNCLNTNVYSDLETPGGQNSNPNLSVVHFFQCQCKLDICGSLRQLFSCIGVKYVLFYCFLCFAMVLIKYHFPVDKSMAVTKQLQVCSCLVSTHVSFTE
jgi:hypothetical protein